MIIEDELELSNDEPDILTNQKNLNFRITIFPPKTPNLMSKIK
jgi:hypothetical protein